MVDPAGRPVYRICEQKTSADFHKPISAEREET
jgi:hypothetical protein